MMSTENNETLDIATLPLADGRYVAIPLLALAEVQQLPESQPSLRLAHASPREPRSAPL